MVTKVKDKTLDRIRPRVEDLLPTKDLRTVFDDTSAALEAGRLVREMRERAGLSQLELAEKLGISQPRVSALEAGRGRDGPSYALLKRIVAACGGTWRIADSLLDSIAHKHVAAE